MVTDRGAVGQQRRRSVLTDMRDKVVGRTLSPPLPGTCIHPIGLGSMHNGNQWFMVSYGTPHTTPTGATP